MASRGGGKEIKLEARRLGSPVPKDLSLFEIDDRLRNLGCVISDALEVSCGVDQAEPGIDSLGVAHDFGFELFLDGAIIAVDPFISGDDGLRPSTHWTVSRRRDCRVNLRQGLQGEVFERLGNRKGLRISR